MLAVAAEPARAVAAAAVAAAAVVAGQSAAAGEDFAKATLAAVGTAVAEAFASEVG